MKETNLRTIRLYDNGGRRKYPTPSERKKFLKYVPILNNPVRQVYCEVLCYTGCRRAEGYNLQLEHFDIADGGIVIECLKRRKRGIYRFVPVRRSWLKSAYKVLVEFAETNEKPSIWGCSEKTCYRAIKEVMEAANLEGAFACPKGLRHGYCIKHSESKTNIKLVKDWAGHSDITSTLVYMDAQGEEARKAASVCW